MYEDIDVNFAGSRESELLKVRRSGHAPTQAGPISCPTQHVLCVQMASSRHDRSAANHSMRCAIVGQSSS